MMTTASIFWIGLFFCVHASSKLRSWMGPDLFYQGQLPSRRYSHGFAASDQENLFVFGGSSSGELSNSFILVEATVIIQDFALT